MTIFKSYDIRGIYPAELTEDTAYKIGKAFVTFLKAKQVLVGQDGRASSPKLFNALAKGITEMGADVINIGLASSPMFYFAAAKADASIMVTASHNPKEYNGFKLCSKAATPISGDTGIKEIEELVNQNRFQPASKKGQLQEKDILKDYISHNLKFIKAKKRFKIVVDAANGMGSYDFPKIFAELDIDFIPLYCDMDFNFPNHEANPLKYETLEDLREKVIEEKADLGVALDGDADRCVLIDEKGEIMTADLVTALVAEELLKLKPKSTFLYDLRSSKAVKEAIESRGGKAIMCRVGHSYIKQQMRETGALFAGELSGHFYYKDSFYTESTFITTAMLLNLMSEENKKASELIKPLRKYFHSGEINSDVRDKERKLEEIEEKYSNAVNKAHLDGLSIYYNDWWFNVRPSNTEPLLRLNLEADTKELMEKRKKELLSLIRS